MARVSIEGLVIEKKMKKKSLLVPITILPSDRDMTIHLLTDITVYPSYIAYGGQRITIALRILFETCPKHGAWPALDFYWL